MEHSSFKAITLLIKKASYCISICLYMLNPKLIAFPSKERSDPDWGLPSQSLRAVHCEAGQTHPPIPTPTSAHPQPRSAIETHIHFDWFQGKLAKQSKLLLRSYHLSLLLLTFSIMSSCWSWSFFLLYEKNLWIAEKTLLNVTMLLLSNPKAPNLEPLTGVLIPQLN